MDGSASNLMISAFGGSLLTQLFAWVCRWHKRRNRRKALFSAIIAECHYNLSILDEVTDGLVNANGSFKRLSVEFFKNIRQQLIDCSVDESLLMKLSRLIVDLELFNMEADYVFNGDSGQDAYLGESGDYDVVIVRQVIRKDISSTVKAARLGVEASLKTVIKHLREMGYESED